MTHRLFLRLCSLVAAACVAPVLAAAVWTAPAGAETLVERLSGPGTHAAITLELPYAALEALIARDIPERYAGTSDDVSDRLRDDRLRWEARVTGLTAGPWLDRGVRLAASVVGRAQVSARLAGLTLAESVDLDISVQIRAAPAFRPDYGIDLAPEGRAVLHRAEMRLMGLRFDFARRLQPRLDAALADALEARAEALARRPVLRAPLEAYWRDACDEVGGIPGGAKMIPTSIAVSEPAFTERGIRLGIVVSAELRLGRAASAPCPPMPAALGILAPR